MTQPDPVDIVLVDDHPLLVAGLQVRLADRGVTLAVAPIIDHESILGFVAQRNPRLVLLDHAIPPMGVSTGLIAPLVRAERSVLVLTGTNDPALWGQLLSVGACAILGKDEPLDAIIDAICDVLDGRAIRTAQAMALRDAWIHSQAAERERMAPFAALSNREALVMWALYEGRTPAQVAKRDYVSVDTVRTQVKSAFRKLGVSSQLEAVALIRESGWALTP